MTDLLLIIFIKNPVLGQVKTRLAATVGDERALKIYLKLLGHTERVTSSLPVEKVVFYSDSVEADDLWDHSIYLKQLQSPGDLGEKMQSAFEWGFESGYKDICIIGSDCLELTPKIIMNGFEALITYDAVLGPTRDGGYYLLGLKKMRAELFQNKNWGTDSVAADTLSDLNELDLDYRTLETLNDVDTEDDLPKELDRKAWRSEQ
jgi:hypothetical protein